MNHCSRFDPIMIVEATPMSFMWNLCTFFAISKEHLSGNGKLGFYPEGFVNRNPRVFR